MVPIPGRNIRLRELSDFVYFLNKGLSFILGNHSIKGRYGTGMSTGGPQAACDPLEFV